MVRGVPLQTDGDVRRSRREMASHGFQNHYNVAINLFPVSSRATNRHRFSRHASLQRYQVTMCVDSAVAATTAAAAAAVVVAAGVRIVC